MEQLLIIWHSIQNHNPVVAGIFVWLVIILVAVNAMSFVARSTPKPPCTNCSNHPFRKGH